MDPAPRHLIDTNVLLRISQQRDPHHQIIGEALEELERRRSKAFSSLQNIVEFWNVCTRPEVQNGFGLTIAETGKRVANIERTMTFLPDNDKVYFIWRQLVVDHNVSGVQVHDAHLVATMRAHGITHILTLNHRDFARYTDIQAIRPSEVPLESE